MCAPIALEIMKYIGSGLPSVTSYFQKVGTLYYMYMYLLLPVHQQ